MSRSDLITRLDLTTIDMAVVRRLTIKAEPGLEHAVKRVVFEEISFLDIGGERRVTPMAAELLQLSRVDPPVFGGIHGAALKAVSAQRMGIEPNRGAADLNDPGDRAGVDRVVPDDVDRGPVRGRMFRSRQCPNSAE